MKELALSILIALSLNACANGSSCNSKRTEYNNSKLYSGKLEYTIPKSWMRVSPSNPMRIEQFRLKGPANSEDAELSIYHFPGKGGSVENNLKRWISKFEDTSALKKEKFNLGKLPITKVYISGTYLKSSAPMIIDSPKIKLENYSMLALMVETADGPWFFKAVGPQASVDLNLPSINSFQKSFCIK